MVQENVCNTLITNQYIYFKLNIAFAITVEVKKRFI